MRRSPSKRERKPRCLVIGLGDSRGFLAYKQRALSTLKRFEEIGWQPTLLWFSRLSNLGGSDMTLRSRWIDIPMPPFCAGNPLLCRMSRAIGRLLIRMIVAFADIDLIVAESSTAGALGSNLGAPLICDFHGDTVEEKKLLADSERVISLAEEDERVACRNTAGWICVSDPLREVLQSRHGVSVPAAIVPCSVNASHSTGNWKRRNRARLRLGVADRPVVCYAGGLSKYQEIPRTLRLVRRMRARDARVYFLLITRDRTDQFAPELFALGEEMRDYRCLSLSHAEVMELLPAADLGILLRAPSPINYVSSPTKCGEYLVSGVPVLTTTHAGDAPRIIEDTLSGLVLRGESDSEECADLALEFLHRSMQNRSAVGERCRLAAAQYYNASDGATKIASLLQELHFAEAKR